ncbi:MAG: signal recognition particle protein, partial [Clostridia bacterium]|nr:signal recognition particle protein [Clostridia bacterium]
MAFEGLGSKLQSIFKKLSSKGRLTEDDIKIAMKEVKMALLEADVNFKVVKSFIGTVSERAVGADVLESLTPDQQVIKIVREELTELMGATNSKLLVSDMPPTVIMMAGLQGAGKTTMAAKLAQYVRKNGKKPMLVGIDIYRPAAIKQLEVLAKQINVDFYEEGTNPPEQTAKNAIERAKYLGCDVVILDTAGRLQIDEEMMQELEKVRDTVHPTEILFTVDAMTGQEAVNVAKTFDERLNVTGVVITKLDGDTRGGAALSIKAVVGKPIKFCGIGEKISDIEVFHPDRMAQRILGMGDVLTLIEKAEAAIDEKNAVELQEKIRKQTFTLEDFLEQFEQLKKMGPLSGLLDMVPGMNKLKGQDVEIDEREMERTVAIIKSMTTKERLDPNILNAGRRKRI